MLTRITMGLAAAAAATSANAALTINAADVSADKYTYQIMYENFDQKFVNDTIDRFFMDPYTSVTSGAKYVRKATSSFAGQASFTYKFDFTALGYQIVGVNTMEILNTYTTDGLGGINILYSLDGVNFTKKYGLAAATDAYNYADPGYRPEADAPHPDLSSYVYGPTELQDSSVFYYRCEFDVVPGSESASSTSKMAWGRRGQDSYDPMFKIDFDLRPTTVPEPTGLALIGTTGALLLRRRME